MYRIPKLLFDATVLTNVFDRNMGRSGIFFVAHNLLESFLKRDDIEVVLYCDDSRIYLLEQYLKLYNLDLKIINKNTYNWITYSKMRARKLKKYCKDNNKIFLKHSASLNYSFWSALARMVRTERMVPQRLKERLEDIDYYFSPMARVPYCIKQQNNILASVFLHDTIPLILQEYKKLFHSSTDWFYALMKSLSEEEIYFANSACTKNDFMKYSNCLKSDRIAVAYLAASSRFCCDRDEKRLSIVKTKYNIPHESKYIFSLCTLDPRKNIVFAVKNFIKFIEKNQIDDLYFVMGGSDWNNFMRRLAKEVENFDKYKNKIIRAGYVDDEDLPILYSNSFCFVYPSKYEGFGMPVLEAMQSGAPVITSDRSSIPEVIGDAGIMVNPEDGEAFVKALEAYYFDNDFRLACIKKGLDRAKEFSWEKCAEVIVEKLCKEKEPAAQKVLAFK